MLAEGLSTRYEFGGDVVGDALVRRTSGRRLEDGREVTLIVFEDAAGVGQAQGQKAVDAANSLAGLRLAPVLACLEAGRDDDGHVYMVFESSDLPSLKSVIRERGGVSPAEALDVAHVVARVLDVAASVGVSHLDLTSSNIFCNVGSGEPLRVRIGGFLLGDMLPSYSPMKKTAPYFGNAEYMAPEVCSGRPGNPSSDLYALGILLYEMVTGKPPFVSAGASTTIKRQVYEKPLPLHLVKPGLQQLDSFEALVMRLLSKDPTGRPASAGEVVAAIEKLRDAAFPGVTLAMEEPREDFPRPVSTFPAALPQPVQVSGAPGETMAFEGLSEAVARMIESQGAAAPVQNQEPAPVQNQEPEAGAKTEAFDASFIAAVVEQAAAGGDIGEAIADARAASAEVSGPAPAASQEKAAPKPKGTKKAPKAKFEKAHEPESSREMPAPAVKPPKKQTETAMRKPAGGKKKGGAVIVVVILVLAVLLAIGIAFWWKNRAPAAVVPAVETGMVTAPTAGDPGKAAADRAHVQALEKVRLGRMMLDKGDFVGAEAAAAEAAAIQRGCPEAEALRSDIAARRPAENPAPVQAAAAPAQASAGSAAEVPVVYRTAARGPAEVQPPAQPAAEQPAPQPVRPRRQKTLRTDAAALKDAVAAAPAPVTQEAGQAAGDPRTEANALRAKARKAYKSGDCATAVNLLERVRSLGQFNDLDAGVMKKCAAKAE